MTRCGTCTCQNADTATITWTGDGKPGNPMTPHRIGAEPVYDCDHVRSVVGDMIAPGGGVANGLRYTPGPPRTIEAEVSANAGNAVTGGAAGLASAAGAALSCTAAIACVGARVSNNFQFTGGKVQFKSTNVIMDGAGRPYYRCKTEVAYTNLTMMNGWTAVAGRPPRARKTDGAIVMMAGQAQIGSVAPGTVIANIPAGTIRPTAVRYYMFRDRLESGALYLSLQTNGNIVLEVGWSPYPQLLWFGAIQYYS